MFYKKLTRSDMIVPTVALLAAIINILPRLTGKPGGDIFFHYSVIECFAQQFWHGDLAPRWCMDVNGGLGSPVLFFYFPIPYLMTAIFYPLHYFGMTAEGEYSAGLILASMMTFITCQCWLKEIVSQRVAFLGAFLLLWMPYRMELIMERSAYAELWAIAWMPLLFHYTRKLMRGEHSWPQLALTVGIGFLTHVPVTCNALICCGLYSLMVTGWAPRRWLRFFVSAVLGGMLSAIFILPARYFESAIDLAALDNAKNTWSLDFITLHSFSLHPKPLITSAVMLLFALVFARAVLMQRRTLPDRFIYRESVMWVVIMLSACVLSFPVSAPIWDVVKYVAPFIAAPWRMRLLIMFALVFLFAVKMQWLMTPKKLKTWKMDYALTCGLFVLLSFFLFVERVSDDNGFETNALQTRAVITDVLRTRWMEADQKTFIMNYCSDGAIKHRVDVLEGAGQVKVEGWNTGSGITLQTDMQTPAQLRIWHFYFPNWHASVDEKAVELQAESMHGLMQLPIPAGKHEVRIVSDVNATAPGIMRLAYGLSAVSLIVIGAGIFVRRAKPETV